MKWKMLQRTASARKNIAQFAHREREKQSSRGTTREQFINFRRSKLLKVIADRERLSAHYAVEYF